MSTRRWSLTALLLVGACAGPRLTAPIPADRLAQLPVDQQRRIFDAQRRVDVAQENVNAARVAEREAWQFRKVAASEVAAAQAESEAARAALDLGRQTRDQETLDRALRAVRAATDRLTATRQKKEYADRLVDLRAAQLDEQQAEVDATRARVGRVMYEALQRNNLAVGVDPQPIMTRVYDAESNLGLRRMRVAELQGVVESTRIAWEMRRRTVESAAREMRAIPAPPAPRLLPVPPLPPAP
jgi:hypothetical protein